MSYDFRSLNWADFEDLARDLIGSELGVRFEAFSAGPDGGIDGRHAGAGTIILQAKHYAGSPFSNLKSQIRKERRAIDRLAPDRYILVTSRALSPKNKADLAQVIGRSLKNVADIFGPEDLNALLRKFPEVQKAHFKLWLTGAAMLERILGAATHTFNEMTREDIENKLRVYANNPSLQEANQTLASQHVVIISGPPGVGKTTLAEILCFTHIAGGWELVALRDLDTAFSRITEGKKQIFMFDDFLGKIALDRRALSQKDSHLARFIKRVRSSPNARFVLSTRAYIFEEARRVSEHLADKRLDVTKYVLNVGVYTRRIKARILYNHLFVSGVSQLHIAALIKSGLIPKVVDHEHYNPRLIEWMTDAAHVNGIAPKDYPRRFMEALDHPADLWDIAFRTHISPACQHLLLTLFFCSEFGVGISDLRVPYNAVHLLLSRKYGLSTDPKDFEEALRILEGGFIEIAPEVDFVNPSLRDYLSNYLHDFELLCDLAAAAATPGWAQAVWTHGTERHMSQSKRARFAAAFEEIARRVPEERGLRTTDRLLLLIDWWSASKNVAFMESALAVAKGISKERFAGRDGPEVVELIGRLRDFDDLGELPFGAEIADRLEEHCVRMIEVGAMASDELENISDTVENWQGSLAGTVLDAVAAAIWREFEALEDVIAEIDSESALEEHATTLKKLGPRAGVPPTQVKRAMVKVNDRISSLEGQPDEATSHLIAAEGASGDSFDDAEMRDLFLPLLERAQKRR